MRVGKFVLAFDALAAFGILGAVALFLGFFAYMAGRGSPIQPAPVAEELATPTTTSTMPVVAIPQIKNLQPLPIQIGSPFRHLSDGGNVIQLRNLTDKTLLVAVSVERDISRAPQTGKVEIPASGMVELGWDREWSFRSGDRVTLSNPDYLAGTWTVP